MFKLRYFYRVASLVGLCLAGRNFAGDLLGNNTFDNTAAPWSTYMASPDLASGELVAGKYVMHINSAGVNKWDIQFRHQGLTLEQNHSYTIKFTLTATKATQAYLKIGQSGAPYNEYWNNNWAAFSLNANEPFTFEQTFTMTEPTDAGCEFAFHLGNGVAGEVPFDMSFDNIYLEDPQYVPPASLNELPKPDIRFG